MATLQKADAMLPLLTFSALILCPRTRMSGQKWPWVLFIILGFGQLATNWGTGEWQLNLLSVLLRRRAILASQDAQ